MTLSQRWREYYNSHDDYNDWIREDGWMIPDCAARSVHCRLTDPLARVLDVGCGTGVVGARLRHLGFMGPLTGIDIAERRLREARTLVFRDGHVYDHVRRGDACALPWKQPQFDTVVSAGMLGLIGVTALLEMLRVVKPGGNAVVTVGFLRSNSQTHRQYRSIIKRILRLNETGKYKLLYARNIGSGYTGERQDEQYGLFVLGKPAL